MSPKNNQPVRLLIADDHEMFRKGFHTILRGVKNIKLVGEASNGIELIELTGTLHPDIIITDINMPEMDGIEATKVLNEKYPNIGVIALSMYMEEGLIIDMLEAGAQGYLSKNTTKEEVLEAIYTVLGHKTYYCRETTTRLIRLIAKSKFSPRTRKPQQEFTKRERDIIKMVCEERANKDIAVALNLSIRTVEGYREKIQEKMQVKNTAGIVVYAIKKGIYKIWIPGKTPQR
jgi:DNA-binding NarL/FixJ family response regulator